MAISPVLKWVGGKRQLLGELLPLVAKVPYERYIEPFFGGAHYSFRSYLKMQLSMTTTAPSWKSMRSSAMTQRI